MQTTSIFDFHLNKIATIKVYVFIIIENDFTIPLRVIFPTKC